MVVWQMPDGQEVRRWTDDAIRSAQALTFSPNAQFLALAAPVYGPASQRDRHGEVQLWRTDVAEPRPAQVLRTKEFLYEVAWNGATQVLVAPGESTNTGGFLGKWEWWPSKRPIYVWSMPDARRRTWTSPQHQILDLALSADGHTLITSGTDGNDHRTVCVWRVP